MRFASLLKIAALTSMMLAAMAALAQINPATQIKWPGNCDAGAPIYNTYTGLCTSTSGSGYILPVASSGTIGGVKSKSVVAHYFMTGISSTDG